MSEQNSMFNPLEQDGTQMSQEPTYVPRQPRITQKLTNDPNEQATQRADAPPPPWQQASIPPLGAYETYDNGYTGDATQRASNYEKLAAQPDIIEEKWIYLLIGIVVGVVFSFLFASVLGGLTPLLIVVIVGFLVWAYTGNRSVLEDAPRVFAVEDMATLVIQNTVGSLHVHRGEAQRVIVKATRRANGRFSHPEETQLSFIQQGNQLVMNATSQSKRSGLVIPAYVTLDIEVPVHCDLQIDQKIGLIKLDNIEGQLRLKQNIGTMQAKNVILHQQTDLELNVGSMEFDGEIDPTGAYRYKVHVGSMGVHLPANSSFEVHTSTNIGSATNHFNATSVGPAPHAKLDLDVNIGSLTLRPR